VRPAWLTRRRLVVAAILLAGWTAAAVIYVTATPAEEDADVAEMFQSKKYRRQLEMIGGKSSLLAADLEDWFSSLWQGRTLATTTAVLTAAVALGAWWWTRPPEPPGDDPVR
jgi:hypothetical protein